MNLHVDSEISTLQRLIIHSPDSGLGKVVPSKAQDWLFEDIVHLDTMRRYEYDVYVKLLLFFLDPEKIKGQLNEINTDKERSFFNPNKEGYFASDKVIEVQTLLEQILSSDIVKTQLVAAVCAIEECSYKDLQHMLKLSDKELTLLLISGTDSKNHMHFPPIPNLIFTRDLGIMINDHLLLNKPAKKARSRESLLTKFIFFNHPYFEGIREKIIEIEESEHHFLMPGDNQNGRIDTLEGGDVMTVAPNHVFIGISERTSLEAARQAMKKLFERNVVQKVTLIKIPVKRDYMHIDTIFTQVKRNVWVLLGSLGRVADSLNENKIWEELGQKQVHEDLIIHQFELQKDGQINDKQFENLEDLLTSVSKDDLQCADDVKFVYSGNNQFPYMAREQWTDSCNLLMLKEGVGIAYDRNDHTANAFIEAGFKTITAKKLLNQMENDDLTAEQIEDTIILLPSAELSRARGGSHCMSMPLTRVPFK